MDLIEAEAAIGPEEAIGGEVEVGMLEEAATLVDMRRDAVMHAEEEEVQGEATRAALEGLRSISSSLRRVRIRQTATPTAHVQTSPRREDRRTHR